MIQQSDKKFLNAASAIGQIFSKDPSSKVGALAVGETNNLVAFGYNGMPPGLRDTAERLNDRTVKYSLTLHAEVNALANASFPVRTLYVTHHPCAQCALHILAARSVKRVVYVENAEFEARWRDSLAQAKDLLLEGGVAVVGVVL